MSDWLTEVVTSLVFLFADLLPTLIVSAFANTLTVAIMGYNILIGSKLGMLIVAGGSVSIENGELTISQEVYVFLVVAITWLLYTNMKRQKVQQALPTAVIFGVGLPVAAIWLYDAAVMFMRQVVSPIDMASVVEVTYPTTAAMLFTTAPSIMGAIMSGGGNPAAYKTVVLSWSFASVFFAAFVFVAQVVMKVGVLAPLTVLVGYVRSRGRDISPLVFLTAWLLVTPKLIEASIGYYYDVSDATQTVIEQYPVDIDVEGFVPGDIDPGCATGCSELIGRATWGTTVLFLMMVGYSAATSYALYSFWRSPPSRSSF